MRTETDAILSLQRFVNGALPWMTEVLTEVEDERLVRPYAVVSANGDRTTTGRRGAALRVLPVSAYVYVDGTTRAGARLAAEDAREALDRAFVESQPAGVIPLYDYTGSPATYRVIAGGTGSWRLELDGRTSAPLSRQADPRDIRLAAEALAQQTAPDLADATGVVVFGRPLAGVYDVRFDGDFRGRALPGLAIADAAPDGPDRVLELLDGQPQPWRGPRDYLGVEAFTLGLLRDPSDPLRRTVTAGMRLTWGRAVPDAPDVTLQGVAIAGHAAST